MLVLAGAGTGKTRVLTTRIAHILATRRAFPGQILSVTFTNKAAREMKERIGNLVGGAVEGMPWLGTFHSIGVKILRRHAELVGLKSGFTILDTDDQIRLLKQVIEAEGLDKDRWPARQLASLIDSWKNRGLTPDKVPAGEAFGFASGKGAQLYAAYQRRLKELNACDFGDLLLENLRLFLDNPDVLADYQRRFRYILVDEYQDTNVAQYLWLRLARPGLAQHLLRRRRRPVDLRLARRRGRQHPALREGLPRRQRHSPRAQLPLDRAHPRAPPRASSPPTRAASARRCSPMASTGAKVTVSAVWDDEEEARTIGDDIEAMQKRSNQPLNEVAILVRASFQMRAFEDRFITMGLPYRVIGGPRFYERQEIKDAIAYLEIAANPANDLKFERIINVPKRGLGDTSVKRVHELGRARSIPMYQAAQMIIETEELPGKARKSLADLIASFERWRSHIGHMKHTELAELILDESGYTAMWQADKSPQAQSRLENLKELVRFMHEFDTLEGFLEHVSLVMDTEQAGDGQKVSVMTLHAAKGLEFEVVFLPGWEEGLFPHQRSLDESGQAGLEEERRLAYVGITRARRIAKVSFAQNRRNRGLYQSALPSRFVDELPEAHVEVSEPKMPFGGAYQNFGGTFGRGGYGRSRFDDAAPFEGAYDTPGWQRAQERTKEPKKWSPADQRKARGPVTIEGELVAASSESASYKRGERVLHQKFGVGTITDVDGNKLTIEFDEAGRKRVVDSFVDRA